MPTGTNLAENATLNGMAGVAPRVNALIEKVEEGAVDRGALWVDLKAALLTAMLPLLEDEEIRRLQLDVAVRSAPLVSQAYGQEIFFQTSVTEPLCLQFKMRRSLIVPYLKFMRLANGLPMASRVTSWFMGKLQGEVAGSPSRLLTWAVSSKLTKWFIAAFVMKATPISEAEIRRRKLPGIWIDAGAITVMLEDTFYPPQSPGLSGAWVMPSWGIFDEGGRFIVRRFPKLARWFGGWDEMVSGMVQLTPEIGYLVFGRGLMTMLGENLAVALGRVLEKYGC